MQNSSASSNVHLYRQPSVAGVGCPFPTPGAHGPDNEPELKGGLLSVSSTLPLLSLLPVPSIQLSLDREALDGSLAPP